MNVPKLRFKEFDGEWEDKKLKDLILTIEAGVSVNSMDTSVSDTVSKAVLKTSAISKGNFNHKENKKVIEEDLERVKKPVKADTILVSRMNTPALVGEVGYVEDDHLNLYLPDRLWEVAVNKNITTAKWLVSALVTDKNEYKIKSLGTGTSGSMKNIAKSDFFNIDIKVPDLKEQFKIQSFMGILNKKIQLQQQKIDLLQEQRKGYLQKIFPKAGEMQPEMRFEGFEGDWEERKLKEVGKIITGNTPSTTDKSNYAEQGILWVTPTDIKHLITTETSKKLSIKGEKIARVVPSGTILVTCIASIGKNTMVLDKSGFNQQINSLTPNSNNDSYFLLTQSEFWSRKMKNIAASGTMQIVNKNEFSNLIFSYPTLEEQQKIGAFFKKMDENIVLQQKKLNIYKKQRQGFMQQMFI